MIDCDDPNCVIQWFHSPCVGVDKHPQGKWFCPTCREQRVQKTVSFAWYMSTLRYFMGDLCNLPTLDIEKKISITILVTYSLLLFLNETLD